VRSESVLTPDWTRPARRAWHSPAGRQVLTEAGLTPAKVLSGSGFGASGNSLSADRDELTATGRIRLAKAIEHYRHLIGELAGSVASGRPDVGRPVPPLNGAWPRRAPPGLRQTAPPTAARTQTRSGETCPS
jgi:hypothetical protein